MSLITSWTDYDQAIDQILETAQTDLAVFDPDLTRLRLESPSRNAQLLRLLSGKPAGRVTLVIQRAEPFLQEMPRLQRLLRDYSHCLEIRQGEGEVVKLTDTLVLADQHSALVRFHRDQPRSRLILADPGACAPYRKRFEAILAEGGQALSTYSLGL